MLGDWHGKFFTFDGMRHFHCAGMHADFLSPNSAKLV
jgi:hypothetical protein